MAEKNKILVIDDNESFLEIFSTNLQVSGYEVYTEVNAKNGFERIYDIMPDLIILDIYLPDKTGFEIAEEIKKDERISSIPIMLITADTSDTAATVDEAFNRGADDCIFKPVNMDDTLKRIANLLNEFKK
ncbi:MAG: response regulator [Elusimicrobia bacterium]|nr:response regulator [Elusimicrobiota bacterium]